MPFKSEKQRSFMYQNHPAVARRWAKKYGNKPATQMKDIKTQIQETPSDPPKASSMNGTSNSPSEEYKKAVARRRNMKVDNGY